MALIGGNTKWVFFLSAAGAAESRHIMDIAFGILCLGQSGISVNDIEVYIDGKDRAFINQFISNGTGSAILIKESKDFFVDQKSNTYENVVMFITGHGGPNGLDATIPISPYALLDCLKFSPNLQKAVVYLGQCYAGIFNYIGAGKKLGLNGAADPEIIFIGATNLHSSLSSYTSENFLNGPISWVANLFLLFLFKWISNPIDVDGDGKFTIIDSYKYAGVYSNAQNKNLKVISLAQSHDLQEKWILAKKSYQASATPANKLAMDAAYKMYESVLNILYVHQECWILNAIPSQSIVLK